MKTEKLIPIKLIKKWKSTEEMHEHCQHIIDHADRYIRERVWEARQILAYNEQI